MALLDEYVRVSPENLCPVCQKSDWCLVHESGNDVICPRTKSNIMVGAAGWRHDGPFEKPVQRNEPVKVKLSSEVIRRVLARWLASGLNQFSNETGLSMAALRVFRPVYNKKKGCFGVPMHNADFEPVGIRFRRADGRKFSLKGGSEGLFLPYPVTRLLDAACLTIAEGFTDAAALNDMGYRYVIGRPSCTGGSRHIVELVQRLNQLESICIVADNDKPGIEGAIQLADCLRREPKYWDITVVSIVGYKDVRDYVLNHKPLEAPKWQRI